MTLSILGSESPEKAEERRTRLADAFSVPKISPEALGWQFEKETAPIATRDAVEALLEESRAQARWGRWMFWLTVANVVLAAAASIVVLVGR